MSHKLNYGTDVIGIAGIAGIGNSAAIRFEPP